MKALHALLLALCIGLTACFSPPYTPPPPPPIVVGNYRITEFDQNGLVAHSWHVTAFRETQFPRTVTFDTGVEIITLSNSYQIDQLPAK